jgi:uncharacterized protein (DUF488 family)
VDIYTIGFTQTTAGEFFGRLRDAHIERLLDVRLNNRSQLAGFAKRDDLRFFLQELVGATYEHAPLLAPTQEILDAYKKAKTMSWGEYERRFMQLMTDRQIEAALDALSFQRRTVLLCSEASPRYCHRRLVIDYLSEHWADVQAVHL